MILKKIIFLTKFINFIQLIAFNISFYKTPLMIAIEKENIEIIQILLANPKLDVNLQFILSINILLRLF